MDNGYFVKFNDDSKELKTYNEHLKILKENEKVIWGQWSLGKKLLSKNTKEEMNKKTFYLYANNKEQNLLLKMRVIKVLTIEEVKSNNLTYLIPEYYREKTYCSAYYLIDKIEKYSCEELKKLESINTGRNLGESGLKGNASGNAPWHVKEIENITKENPLLELGICPNCFQKMTKVEYFIPEEDRKKYKDQDFTKPKIKYFCGYCEITSDNNEEFSERNYNIPNRLFPTEKQVSTIYLINQKMKLGLRPLTKKQCIKDIGKYLDIAMDKTIPMFERDSIRIK